MIRLQIYDDGYALFFCPACQTKHALSVKEGGWEFNGSCEEPVTNPSILVSGHDGAECHCYLEGTKIRYCADAPHEFAGQTVDLPECTRD